jgi:hypothetical protein
VSDLRAAELVRVVDGLEERAATGYVMLQEVEAAIGAEVGWAIDEALLVVDYRMRVDGSQVILCRLNRHHPAVAALTRW